MGSTLNNTLMDLFMRQMIEPITNAFQKTTTELSEDAKCILQKKIRGFRENLIEEITRIYSNPCTDDKDVDFIMEELLNKVEKMEELRRNEAPISPPVSMSDLLFEYTHQPSDNSGLGRRGDTPLQESVNVPKLNKDIALESLSRDIEPILVEVLPSDSENDQFNLVSPPTSDHSDLNVLKRDISSSAPSSPEDSVKRMSSRKRTKRSLADTVQMLSTDVKKVSKEESVSPPPLSFLQPTSFTLPQVPVSYSNIQRWLGAPFPNQMYLNALMFQPPKSSEEQLAALMKISMSAANFIKTVDSRQVQKTNEHISLVQESDDIKVDVESDDGEAEISPSPSNGDMDTESSASSCPAAASPASGDCDSSTDKPFICVHNNCGKRFANKFLLKKHMFIHTGLRPHTCPHCHKKFNRKDNLLRHKKTHSPTAAQLGQVLPKVSFAGFPSLPALHNLALPTSFNHFHSLKLSLDAGAPAVRSLS